jgi:hypothetical protein
VWKNRDIWTSSVCRRRAPGMKRLDSFNRTHGNAMVQGSRRGEGAPLCRAPAWSICGAGEGRRGSRRLRRRVLVTSPACSGRPGPRARRGLASRWSGHSVVENQNKEPCLASEWSAGPVQWAFLSASAMREENASIPECESATESKFTFRFSESVQYFLTFCLSNRLWLL